MAAGAGPPSRPLSISSSLCKFLASEKRGVADEALSGGALCQPIDPRVGSRLTAGHWGVGGVGSCDRASEGRGWAHNREEVVMVGELCSGCPTLLTKQCQCQSLGSLKDHVTFTLFTRCVGGLILLDVLLRANEQRLWDLFQLCSTYTHVAIQ